MKILYFHQHFSTPKGAAGLRSYEMARNFIRRGHQVTMVCGSYGGGDTGLTKEFVRGKRRGIVAGIDVIEFQLSYSNSDSFLKRTVTFLRFALQSVGVAFRENYDLVFATTTPLTAGIPGILARWMRGKTFVFEVRDLWPELPKAMGVIKNPVILWLMEILEWTSYHSAHRLIGLSSGICEGIIKSGISSDKVALIPNGCDLDVFAEKVAPWRPAGVSPQDLMAVFAGTHGIANGLESVLLSAKVLLDRNRDDIKIVLIGQGKLKSKLIKMANEQSLTNVLFAEPVNKEKLSGLFAATDVGLQILANVPAFYYGTSPNKFFDYLAAGLPVLNNYPGWVSELIERYDCGVVVPPESPVAFADALEKCARDRDLLVIQGRNARHLAELEFDRRKLAEKWCDWLEGAMQ